MAQLLDINLNGTDDNLPDLGFVILRHINSENTNKYWKEAYYCIRKFYKEPILIIDDNSDPNFIDDASINELVNCKIIKGEFPGAGELLGYYYFHKLHPFKKAVIIHDSIFFNKYVDFSKHENFKPIWSFIHNWDDDVGVIYAASYLDNCGEIIRLYLDKSKWNGCFGVMSVIEWDFLNYVNERYNFIDILPKIVKNRKDRMCLERLIPVLFQMHSLQLIKPIYCNIHDYCAWGLTYQHYIDNKMAHLPIIKVWTGR